MYENKKRSPHTNHTAGTTDTIVSHCSVSFASVANPSFVSRVSSKSSRARRRRMNCSKSKRKKSKNEQTTPNKNHRQSHQSPSSLPTITIGWSQTDAHAYKNNKVTIAGNVKPCLRDLSLPKSIKMHLLNCVRCVLATLPDKCSFSLDKEDDKGLKEIRKRMLSEFEKLLGGDGKCANFWWKG